MKKSLSLFCFIFAIIAAKPAFADIVFCPTHANCKDSKCRVSTLGGDWISDDSPKDGTYYFAGAGEGTNYCRYKVPGERTTYIYFTGGKGLRAAINSTQSKWTTASMNHGCLSDNVRNCPWTNQENH